MDAIQSMDANNKRDNKMVEIPGTEGMSTKIRMQQKQKGQKQLEL